MLKCNWNKIHSELYYFLLWPHQGDTRFSRWSRCSTHYKTAWIHSICSQILDLGICPDPFWRTVCCFDIFDWVFLQGKSQCQAHPVIFPGVEEPWKPQRKEKGKDSWLHWLNLSWREFHVIYTSHLKFYEKKQRIFFLINFQRSYSKDYQFEMVTKGNPKLLLIYDFFFVFFIWFLNKYLIDSIDFLGWVNAIFLNALHNKILTFVTGFPLQSFTVLKLLVGCLEVRWNLKSIHQ